MNYFVTLLLLALASGCSTPRPPRPLAYEEKMKRAGVALKEDRIFEARSWVTQALGERPKSQRAQDLMARVIDREIAREKTLDLGKSPEELTDGEKKLQIKTWLERSQGFLEVNELDQALLAAEQIFQLDPDNLEASRQVDQIKQKARHLGKREDQFLQDLYEDEVQNRIERYQAQAEEWIQENRLGAARLAVEKILILEPGNKEAKRLAAELDRMEDPLLAAALSDSPDVP